MILRCAGNPGGGHRRVSGAQTHSPMQGNPGGGHRRVSGAQTHSPMQQPRLSCSGGGTCGPLTPATHICATCPPRRGPNTPATGAAGARAYCARCVLLAHPPGRLPHVITALPPLPPPPPRADPLSPSVRGLADLLAHTRASSAQLTPPLSQARAGVAKALARSDLLLTRLKASSVGLSGGGLAVRDAGEHREVGLAMPLLTEASTTTRSLADLHFQGGA